MQIDFYYRTFGELKEEKELGFIDSASIMASLNDKMRDAVLCNPSGFTNDEVCQILALDGKKIVGCVNAFQSRLKINNEIISVQTGSSLFSSEQYRKENVGGELFYRLTNLHPQKNNFYAGISQMAQPIYKVLKYSLFEFPRLIYLRKSRSVVQALLKSEKIWVKPIIWIVDIILYLHRILLLTLNVFLLIKYKIEQTEDVPEEVETIVMADKHQFMEVHDKAWFEWCLNKTFSHSQKNKKKLFVIKRKQIIEAFFVIKQEFFSQASSRGFKNVYLGSIVEWGIAPASNLKEKDVYILSLRYFDKDIDGIQVATSDAKTEKSLKYNLFVQVGNATMAYKLKTVKCEELNNINNWRVRIAGGDTLLD